MCGEHDSDNTNLEGEFRCSGGLIISPMSLLENDLEKHKASQASSERQSFPKPSSMETFSSRRIAAWDTGAQPDGNCNSNNSSKYSITATAPLPGEKKLETQPPPMTDLKFGVNGWAAGMMPRMFALPQSQPTCHDASFFENKFQITPLRNGALQHLEAYLQQKQREKQQQSQQVVGATGAAVAGGQRTQQQQQHQQSQSDLLAQLISQSHTQDNTFSAAAAAVHPLGYQSQVGTKRSSLPLAVGRDAIAIDEEVTDTRTQQVHASFSSSPRLSSAQQHPHPQENRSESPLSFQEVASALQTTQPGVEDTLRLVLLHQEAKQQKEAQLRQLLQSNGNGSGCSVDTTTITAKINQLNTAAKVIHDESRNAAITETPAIELLLAASQANCNKWQETSRANTKSREIELQELIRQQQDEIRQKQEQVLQHFKVQSAPAAQPSQEEDCHQILLSKLHDILGLHVASDKRESLPTAAPAPAVTNYFGANPRVDLESFLGNNNNNNFVVADDHRRSSAGPQLEDRLLDILKQQPVSLEAMMHLMNQNQQIAPTPPTKKTVESTPVMEQLMAALQLPPALSLPAQVEQGTSKLGPAQAADLQQLLQSLSTSASPRLQVLDHQQHRQQQHHQQQPDLVTNLAAVSAALQAPSKLAEWIRANHHNHHQQLSSSSSPMHSTASVEQHQSDLGTNLAAMSAAKLAEWIGGNQHQPSSLMHSAAGGAMNVAVALPPLITSYDLVPETPRNEELVERTQQLINLAKADMSTWRASRRRIREKDNVSSNNNKNGESTQSPKKKPKKVKV